MKNSKAIVTLAIGSAYLELWKNLCEKNWKKYANTHGYDLISISEPLDDSERAKKRSAAWQKCLILEQDFANDYERVIWIDADILINTSHAPSIVDDVPIEKVGVVEAFSMSWRLQALERCYEYWEVNGGKVVRETPREYHMNFGLPPVANDKIAQTGVMVLSPKHHRQLLYKVYYEYEDKGGPEWHYEARPLSYELLSSNVVHWLDHRFNLLWVFYKMLYYPFLTQLQSDESKTGRVKRKLFSLLGASTKKIEKICVNTAFLNSYFLHFGASQSEMQLVDTDIRSWKECKLI